MPDTTIHFTVNGQAVEAGPPDRSLLSYLREDLYLTGAKNGCGDGACGACTVLVDGRAVRSCTLKLRRVAGCTVETIENLSRDGVLHPIQQAFLEAGAVQCGFCTPGMILTAKALLDRNPNPGEAEIKTALGHNLCRCTGYASVLRAVRLAGRWMAGEPYTPASLALTGPAVGRAMPITEVEKVTGAALFADDLPRGAALYGALVLAPHPHARLTGLELSQAQAVPGVVRILTAKDVPGVPVYGALKPDHPVFVSEEMKFTGDVLALVVAETDAAARQGAAAVKISWEPLPLVDGVEAALKEDAPRLSPQGNILNAVQIRKGDGEAGLKRCDVVVQGEFTTPFIEHAYLEAESVWADYDGHELVVKTGGQCPHSFRQMIAACLGLEEERVRVINLDTGGAFGGKVEPTIQIQCALAAYLLRRPVKMTSSRRESMLLSTKRHAMKLKYRLGAAADGTLLAGQVELYGDTGPYASVGGGVIFRASTTALGPYRYRDAAIDGYAVFTNNCIGGAMRGYGSLQTCFACETMIDELADKLGMDPLEFRLKNVLRPGDMMVTGERIAESVGIAACLEAVRDRLGQEAPFTLDPQRYHLGVGVACSYKNVGIGGGFLDGAGASAVLKPDGMVEVWTGAAEIGQGTRTAMGQIAADAFGVGVERVRVMLPDTRYTLDAGVTTSSRQTFISGNAVKQAAEALKSKVLEALAQRLNAPATPEGDGFRVGEAHYSLPQVCRLLELPRQGLKAEITYIPPETHDLPANATCNEALPPEETRIHVAYSFGAQAALVGVDKETGAIKVDKVIAAHDVGRPINPLLIQGQFEGGIVMSMGYALTEAYPMEDCMPRYGSLHKLGLPMAGDIPEEMACIVVEDPHPDGPYGAKGMGELVLNPTTPAITRALHNITGRDYHHLPVGKAIKEDLHD